MRGDVSPSHQPQLASPTKEINVNKLIAVCVLALTVTGCGVIGSGGPNSPDQTILFAGDTGLACLAVPEKDKADARKAVVCASTILATGTVDTATLLACSESADVPPKYRAAFALVLSRVTARFGNAPVFESGSTAGEAFKAFLSVCSVALA